MSEINVDHAPINDGRIEIPRDIEVDQLEQLLAYFGLPLELWGKNDAKTVASLKKEIESGESIMWFDVAAGLHRDVSVLWLDVIHHDSRGNVYILKEDRQEFKDGRQRRRSLPGSLGEKLQPGERPTDAVARALAEEIGVDDYLAHYVVGEDTSVHAPPTYPGLVSNYTTYSHCVTIGAEAFRAEGYVEHQADKTNYYVWEKLETHDESFAFTVRQATAEDREPSIDLFRRSQAATGRPRFIPPEFLEQRLYDGFVIKRYVAEHDGAIVGHALIEKPNPLNIADWTYGTDLTKDDLLELGRAFVDPEHYGNGIWTELLQQRLAFIAGAGKTAVAATWFENVHVMRTFERLGGVDVGSKSVSDGIISMYRFDGNGRVEPHQGIQA